VILAMAAPEEEQEFRLGWSLWRRAHQAVAKRSHTTSRKAKREPLREQRPHLAQPTPATAMPFFSTPIAARLTDEQWERLRPLMPPQKPPTGRPRRDHRTVLAGMLWIFGTGASWRDLPKEEFGSWRTVYGRYRKWRKEGLWRRIIEALQFGHDVADS
jgi:transposase